MEYVTGVVQNVHSWASKINPSTLSGAIDIVFVKQHDGTYLSTPFYVKFGKLGVLRAKEKRVYIEINGVELDKQMQLDDYGLAYFESVHQEEEEESESVSEAVHTSDHSVRPENREKKSNDCSSNEETYRSLSRASKSIKKHSTNIKKELDQKLESLKNSEDKSEDCEENETVPNESEEKQLTLKLTERELQEEYNLKPGLNEAEFSVTTQYQGTTRCSCSIFVWEQSTKIIISDIDGTITKSDVRGMILPMIGMHDWAQEEVTRLYSRISSNGYQILYLSARSISQAGATRDYIRSLQQGELSLPHGPLFLNPEGAFRAFKKEVIDRQPEVFKIQCLMHLKQLFRNVSFAILKKDNYYETNIFVSGPTPYVAGYGNRPNDIEAYQKVGIPRERIFIINKLGELKGSISKTMLTNYGEQSKLVDYYFPPMDKDLQIDHKYWEAPLPDIGF